MRWRILDHLYIIYTLKVTIEDAEDVNNAMVIVVDLKKCLKW